MKRIVTAALGIVLTGTLASAQMEKKMPTTSKVADTLMAKEHALIDAVKAKNAKAFSALVMPGAWSVDENGYMPVEDLIKALGDPKSDIHFDALAATDMKVVDAGANAAIVTYKTTQKGTFMGQPLPPASYATTIWANHGGTWHAVFHQESVAAKP